MKSKGVAYLLWFFLGVIGAHKFYIRKTGMGILYLFTVGLLGIGWFIDLFTLGHQVDVANMLISGGGSQSQNVTVNVTAPAGAPTASAPQIKINAEKQILKLSNESPILTLKEIIANTDLELGEAETALNEMCSKGVIKEIVDESGKKAYDCS